MKKRLFLLLVVLSSCNGEEKGASDYSVNPLPDPFVGQWANSFTDCDLPAGSEEAAPIEITSSGFIGLENACSFSSVEVNPAGDEAVVQMECSGEGETERRQAFLRVKQNTLLAEWESGGSVSWTRCKVQIPSEG